MDIEVRRHLARNGYLADRFAVSRGRDPAAGNDFQGILNREQHTSAFGFREVDRGCFTQANTRICTIGGITHATVRETLVAAGLTDPCNDVGLQRIGRGLKGM